MIEHLCPVDGVAGFSSEDNVDYWDKNKWDYELSKHQVCIYIPDVKLSSLTFIYIFFYTFHCLLY